MKFELRTKKWFVSKNRMIVEGLITKREMIEIDDHNESTSVSRKYFLRTNLDGPEWVYEDQLFDSLSELVKNLSIPCSIE